jgi:lipoprotein-anchoring transpeptidase ErfK/SrfK
LSESPGTSAGFDDEEWAALPPTRRVACTLLLLVLLGLTWAATASAQAAAPAVKPTQALATLLSAHEAFSKPELTSARIELVPAQRPLTNEQTVLPVLGEATSPNGKHWLQVRLPGRPNSHTGWIKEHATRASTTRWHIVVDTSSRRVTVYERGRPIRSVKAVVGKPSTPTPLGEFFVEESIRLRSYDVGAPFALALSARSNVLQEFAGGPGQIGLHGLMNVGGTPGTAISHGCVRLDNATMLWLVLHVGPGVPVTITG